MKSISNLAAAFVQRQESRKNSIISASSSTLSSNVAEERFQKRSVAFLDKQNQKTVGNSLHMNLNSCNDVTVGDRVTNVYQNYYSKDSKNPAFILSDKNVKFNAKALFVLGQKWCWGLILLSIFLISFANTLLIILWPKEHIELALSPSSWGAEQPRPGASGSTLRELEVPVNKIIVAATGDDPQSCTTRDECSRRVKNLQLLAFENNLPDIPYNFLIGDDGNAYEGRGFRFRGEIFSNGSVIATGLIIAFIGTFNDHSPSFHQTESFNTFLETSLSRGFLTKNYKMVSEDQVKNSDSPASGIFDVIKNSDRFYELVKIFSRSQWGALDPKNVSKIVKFSSPITKVFSGQISFGSQELLCSTLAECSTSLKIIQEKDFSLGYNDIEFNFLISSFGILECRGWDVRPEYPLDDESLIIAFLTDFLYKPGEMLNVTLEKLIADGKFLEKIAEKFEFLCGENFCTESSTEILPTIPPVVIEDIAVSRKEWNASLPKAELQKLTQPVKQIIVTDTSYVGDGVESCGTKNDCLERVKTLQLLSFDKSLDDIPYNFLIGDDGNTYEGRGYEFQGEVAEDETFNNLGLIIAFIGDFTTYLPIDSQIATLEKFLDDLDKREALTTGYKILYEDQMTNSEHFSSQVFDIFVKMEKFYNLSKVYTRSQWGAASPKNEAKIDKFDGPVTKIITSKVDDKFCSSFEECSTTLQDMQELDFLLEFNDMEFNFLISPFGIFEGRGWNVRPEYPQDVDSLCIAFLTDDLYKPGEMLILTLEKLVADGKVMGKLDENVNITT